MSETIQLDTELGPMRVYAQGTITRALQAGQWWDSHLKPHIDSVEGGAAVDIGAHFGWFTRYLSSRFGRVYACEPWPASYRLLEENVPYTNVQLWPVAAHWTTAVLGYALRNDPSDAGAFGFNGRRIDFAQPAVAAVRLDDYLPPDAPITLVKCDAQGADLQALQGMERTIRRCRPLILFEWEEGLAQDHDSAWGDYLWFFEDIGYAPPERISPGHWDYVARPE